MFRLFRLLPRVSRLWSLSGSKACLIASQLNVHDGRWSCPEAVRRRRFASNTLAHAHSHTLPAPVLLCYGLGAIGHRARVTKSASYDAFDLLVSIFMVAVQVLPEPHNREQAAADMSVAVTCGKAEADPRDLATIAWNDLTVVGAASVCACVYEWLGVWASTRPRGGGAGLGAREARVGRHREPKGADSSPPPSHTPYFAAVAL